MYPLSRNEVITMSYKTKYILNRIDAIEMSLCIICSTISNTINTQGSLNNIVSNISGRIGTLKSEYLKQILNLPHCNTSPKSGELLFDELVKSNQLDALKLYLIDVCSHREIEIPADGRGNVVFIDIPTDRRGTVVFTKDVDGERLVAQYPLYELLTDRQMGKLYAKTLNDTYQGIIRSFVSLVKDAPSLEPDERFKLSYTVLEDRIDVSFPTGTIGRFTVNLKQLSDVYRYDLTFPQFYALCCDLDLFKSLVDKED